ncbi:MAG: M1 family aminopeptidase [Deltaproteobacteria bacterium]
MWHFLGQRSAGLYAKKSFRLPTATIHYAPDRQARVERLGIEVWLDGRQPRIRGRTRLDLVMLSDTPELSLDAAELSIDRVTASFDGLAVDTHQVAFTTEDSRLFVTFDPPLAARDRLSLEIDYHGEPRRGLWFVGPNLFDPERPTEVWTQGQDDDSRHWFPCFDSPNQKAPTELIAHVPPGAFALSNGELVAKEEFADESVYRYVQKIPHATYLISLVVGDYEAIEMRAGQLPVVAHVHPHQRGMGERTFENTPAMIELFESKIGVPYPYAQYAQIVVADFIFGGMENTSATTLTDQILFDEHSDADFRPVAESLIAHELAHQWWGDLVTCRDWSHAWLNEGFATYFELLWREHVDGPDEATYARFIDMEAYFAERYRRPLVERTYEEPIELFDRHQYEKGACVLHLLRFLLGEDAFWRSLSHYCETHREGSVETHDLRRAIETTTGRNLEVVFDQWVHSAGHPHVRISGAFDPIGKVFALTVEQTQRGDQITSTFDIPVDVEIAFEGDAEVHRVQLSARRQVFRLPAPTRPTWVIFDRGGHLPKQIDNRLSATMLRSIVDDSDDVVAVILAARTLVKRSDPASLACVTDALANHAFAGVRAECAKALRFAPSPQTLEALIDAVLEDGDARVRRAAIRALARFESDAETIGAFLVRHTEIETSDYAIADTARTIGQLRAPQARDFLMTCLGRTGHNHVIRAAAVEGLAKLRDASLLDTIAVRRQPSEHPRVREAAVTAIGELARLLPERRADRVAARERLEALLDDPWLRVRIRAAEALGGLRDVEAADALRRAAERELDGRARRAMRVAASDLADRTTPLAEVKSVREDLDRLRHAQTQFLARVEGVERRRKTTRVDVRGVEAIPAPEPKAKQKKKRKKKRKKKQKKTK